MKSISRFFPLIVAGALFLAAVGFPLWSAWQGFPIFRDQHLGTAILYSQEGIDLLRPQIVGFTATNTPAPQEFPLWQAVAAVLLKAGGGWWGWANVASLLLFATCLWPMYRLGRRLGKECSWDAEQTGLWAVVCLLAVPVVFYQAGEASVDGWSLAICIWFYYACIEMIESGKWRWFPLALIAGIFAATAKLPFFFAAGTASGMYLILRHSKSPARWVQILAVGGFSGMVFLLWTRWCDSQLALAQFPYWELRLSENPGLWDHYFGTWQYKLNPANWIKGGWRFLSTIFGSFALAGAFLWALISVRSKLLWSWIFGCGMMLLVFTHLVLVHRHYYLIFAPAAALALAGVIAQLKANSRWSGKQWMVAQTAIALALMLSIAQGLMVMEVPLRFDPYPAEIADRVSKLLPPDAKPLVQNGGWGGEIFMRMGRPGLSVHTSMSLKTPEQLTRLKQLGFTHLVLIADSPLLYAFQVTNPGQARLKRATAHDESSPLIESWQPFYEDADMSLFQLP